MSNASRDAILWRVRSSLRPPMVRTPHPGFSPTDVATVRDDVDTWSLFVERLTGVHGHAFTAVDALAAHLRAKGWLRGYCDPAFRSPVGEQLGAGFVVDYDFDLARVDEYQFGITRAFGAIAETGTIVLNDATTSARLAALAPWVHIAVLAPRDLWRDVLTALTLLGKDPNTIWVTGPSKTGDIEGVLVHGAHGPGEQICLRLG